MPKFSSGDRVQVIPELKEWNGEAGTITCWAGDITREVRSGPVVVELPVANLTSEPLYLVQLDKHKSLSLIAESFLVRVTGSRTAK